MKTSILNLSVHSNLILVYASQYIFQGNDMTIDFWVLIMYYLMNWQQGLGNLSRGVLQMIKVKAT